MTARLDPDRLFAEWLTSEAPDRAPERLLAASRDRLRTAHQVRPWWPARRIAETSTFTKYAIAAVALVVIAIVDINLLQRVGGDRSGGPSTSRPASPSPAASPINPSDLVGLVGLPPLGATPTSSETSGLVDSYPVLGGGPPFRGMVRLFADGRMIWYMFFGSQNGNTTGYIEQRLTPEGVVLVRGQHNLLQKDPLHLDSWLPASAWADKQMRPYVPTTFAACLLQFDPFGPIAERVYPQPGPPVERSKILALLPTAAADLLRDKEAVPPVDDAADCLGLTVEEARLLDGALRAGGLEQDAKQNKYVLQYHRDAPGPGTTRITVNFEPRFPDGSVGCSPCG